MAFRRAILLVNCLFFIFHASAHSKRAAEQRVTLGVHVIYGKDFKNVCRFQDSDGRYLEYFTVFMQAVEARFRASGLSNIEVTLAAATEVPLRDVLVLGDNDGASSSRSEPQEAPDGYDSDENQDSAIKDSREIQKISERDDDYTEEEDYQSAETTLANSAESLSLHGTRHRLRKHVQYQSIVYRGADAVIFVTRFSRPIILENDDFEEWNGAAVQGGICGDDRVGVVTDDGNFGGVDSMTSELSLLLGASVDNKTVGDCKKSDNFLLSGSRSGRKPWLSKCSRDSIINFLTEESHRTQNCLDDYQSPAHHNDGKLPSLYYAQKKIDICKGDSPSLSKCPSGSSSMNASECQIVCCEDGQRVGKKRPAADGSFCDGEGICLSGWCTNVSSDFLTQGSS